MSSSRSTSPHSAFSSGGTPPSTLQHAQTQPAFDSTTILNNDHLPQLNDNQQLSSRDRAYNGKHSDNIEHQSATQGPIFQPASDSASHPVSHSAASSSPLLTLNEHYNSPSNANLPFSPANASSRSSRMREVSAPLPSAPPCTPASIVTRQSSLTQFRRHLNSPSAMRNAPSSASFSNIFHSPVAESDVENVEPDSGDSDSNSVEIMTGAETDPFSGRRFTRTSSSSLRSMTYPAQPEPRSNAPSPSSSLINHVSKMSLAAQESASSTASHTPTPHALPRDRQSSELDHTAKQMSHDYDPVTAVSGQATLLSSDGQGPLSFHVSQRSTTCYSSSSDKENDEIVLRPSMGPVPLSDTKATEMDDDSTKVPNIYVNGLPPNFPDESLYLMCKDFGRVLSVRTFTRCVGEKMSGYGFVLFDSIDSAENCIEALKKYRNLHPSFSKQIHKIPGTQFTSGPITLPPVGSLSSLASQPSLPSLGSFPSMASSLVSSMSSPAMHTHLSPSNSRIVVSDSLSSKIGPDFNELSFREKMERLRDENSTNLYMEGLPLTIDETSLAALVSPHKILSSRFFQTKLSNPPRMIAFVRLDSRAGAEEVIERIHSRVVRGWNDNGCRISVRFADTNEQRELRRTERRKHGMEDEESEGSQISMAHAALLNRRGAEAHSHGGSLKPSLSYHDMDQFSGRSKLGDPRLKGLRVSDVNAGYIAHRSAENPLLLPNVPFQGMSNFVNGNDGLAVSEFSPSDLAMLQHQTQMHQLQLLQQMQGNHMRMDWNGFDPNYVRDPYYGHAHNLMPSADIMQADVFPFDSVLPTGKATATALEHGRMRSASKTASHPTGMSKGVSTFGRNDASQFAMGHLEEDFADHHDPLGAAADTHTKHGRTYSADLLRSGGERYERLNALDHRRRATTFVEDGEIPAISPALTYASRTPSTLSPATPLFNTFSTPASVPATVPRSKPSVRERDFARTSYKSDYRQ